MEKDRSSKIIAIVALVVAVVGLSLGFAAFSTNLTIKPAAEIKPKNTMKVEFSAESSSSVTESVEGTLEPEAMEEENYSADNATITTGANGYDTISGLKAHFTKPGQKVTYSFYARNTGELDAYLTKINFGSKQCSAALTDNGASNYEAVCAGITLTVKVGGDANSYTTTDSSIKSHKLAKGANESVEVVIEYTAGAQAADGDITVEFGDVTLTYNSVDNA